MTIRGQDVRFCGAVLRVNSATLWRLQAQKLVTQRYVFPSVWSCDHPPERNAASRTSATSSDPNLDVASIRRRTARGGRDTA